ncbi:MAG: family 20 glycosylhydrolase, partial [Verrucomicrobia bacterium]|nr:family 20 glycosylhydrolase [Verrucomicrobiota bacterium]
MNQRAPSLPITAPPRAAVTPQSHHLGLIQHTHSTRHVLTKTVGLGLAWLCVAGALGAAPEGELNLIPWPKSVAGTAGAMPVGDKGRIVFAEPALEALAKVVSDEICRTCGVRLATASGMPEAGDIGLQLDPQLKGEAYRLEVTDRAVVSGASYQAVALGTTTLGQALQLKGAAVSLPHLAVSDAPDYHMRAIQMCIKHQPHQMSTIKQGVDLCRQYKLNTLALHASNYQILWLLCPAFRDNPLSKDSVPGWGNGGATYSPEEWNDLVEYGRQRGVAILPEWGPEDFIYFMKGWFYKARQFVPDFDETKQSLLDSPKFWQAID